MLLRSTARQALLLLGSCIACLVTAASASGQEEAAADPQPKMWRGVHVMAWGLAGGPEGLAPLKEAIAKVLAPLGVNVIVLEVGYNFDYKSHPELRQTKFITKADARSLLEVCRAKGIRLIPQFNCLGHQSWRNTLYPLLTQYRELEEPPDVEPGKRWTRAAELVPAPSRCESDRLRHDG